MIERSTGTIVDIDLDTSLIQCTGDICSSQIPAATPAAPPRRQW